MKSQSNEHSLLFAIFALQMNFISKDQLLLATSDWLEDKSSLIGNIFIRRDALQQADVDLLDNLVRRHIENHDGDVNKSLATLTMTKELEAELEKLGDDELDATVHKTSSQPATVSIGQTVANSQIESANPSKEKGAPNLSRYRVIRPHAKGGLGEVSVALDVELNREVALKEIQQKFADDQANRTRFVLEAEVTGGLEHPGVVPVYGLGRNADGRPYYAMRFIKGVSLKEAVKRLHQDARKAEKPLDYEGVEMRKLLGRFVDVCYAIAYAHSRGVLHRDLKPSNIMLGKFGETLVVDWGLAKLRGRGDDIIGQGEATLRTSSGSDALATQVGSAIGTPTFMPPEQAEGKLDFVGPASDVYSLGATLYFILANRSPIEAGSVADVLDQVKQGKVRPLREVNPSIPRSLEAICMQAMRRSMEDRYQRVEDLADDIEKFLADEPLAAFQEPMSLRTRRWIRKHQTFTASTAAAVLVSAIGLGVFSSVVGNKNTELSQANNSLQTNVRELQRANLRTTQARARAEENEQAARNQSQLALSTLTSVVLDIQGGLRNLSGGGDTRRRLLETSLARLDEVANEYLDQAKIDASTVTALNELGDLVLRLGASSDIAAIGENQASNVPAVELAERIFEKANNIVTMLAFEDPDNVEIADLLNATNLRLGNAKWFAEDYENAKLLFGQAIEYYQKRFNDDPENADIGMRLAYSLIKLGDVRLSEGEVSESLGLFQDSLDVGLLLVDQDSGDAQFLRNSCVCYLKIGDVQTMIGQSQEAQENFEYAVGIFEQLMGLFPSSTEYKRDLAYTYTRLGSLQLNAAQSADAAVAFEKALSISQQLFTNEPDDIRFHEDVADARRYLAEAKLNSGRVSEAIEEFQLAIETSQSLVDRDPTNFDASRDLASAYSRLGDAQLRLNAMDDAIDALEQALAIQTRLDERDPGNPQTQESLALTLDLLSPAYLNANRIEDAQKLMQRSIDLRQLRVNVDEHNLEAQKNLAGAYFRFGDSFWRVQDFRPAQEAFENGLEILDRILPLDEKNQSVRSDYSVGLERLATIAYLQARYPDALELIDRKRELDEAMVALDPNDVGFKSNLAVSFNRLGSLHQVMDEPDEAIEMFRASLALLKEIAAIDTTALKRQRELTTAYGQLGDALAARGDLDEALDCYTNAAGILDGIIQETPNETGTLKNLSVCLGRIADMHNSNGDYEAALEFQLKAVSACKDVVESGSQSPADQVMVYTSLYRLALAHGELFDFDSANEALARAVDALDDQKRLGLLPEGEERWYQMIDELIEDLEQIKTDPEFDGLREKGRFQELLDRVSGD